MNACGDDAAKSTSASHSASVPVAPPREYNDAEVACARYHQIRAERLSDLAQGLPEPRPSRPKPRANTENAVTTREQAMSKSQNMDAPRPEAGAAR